MSDSAVISQAEWLLLDLKDARFEHAPGVARILAGLVASHPTDEARLERGRQLFDELYAALALETTAPRPSS